MSAPYTPVAASRYYSTGPAAQHSPSMMYMWSTGAVSNGQTGQWIALTPTDFQPAATVSNNSIPSGVSGPNLMLTGQILAANPNRTNLFIQNVGTGSPLYVKYGVAPASQQSFSMVLAAATADFGAGGSVSDATWKGPVAVSGSTRGIWFETL